MATTSVRVAAKRRLVELLTAALPDVQVAYAWPGEDMQDECVFLGSTIGNVSVRDFRAGRKARDDTFTIVVHFYTSKPGWKNPDDADVRVEELYGVLEDVLATNPKLADANGVALDGVLWAAQLGGAAEYAEPDPGPEGWIGEASAQVQVKTLLT